MLLTSTDLETIQRYCRRHRRLVEESAKAGCLSCGASFAPAEITEWFHEAGEDSADVAGETAICPRCGVHSVFPSAAPIALDARMLAALQAFWFSSPH